MWYKWLNGLTLVKNKSNWFRIEEVFSKIIDFQADAVEHSNETVFFAFCSYSQTVLKMDIALASVLFWVHELSI